MQQRGDDAVGVERQLGDGARDPILRQHLGETYGQIQPYLIPSGYLAQSLPCVNYPLGHHCNYRVVEEPEPDGTFAAVCDQHFCPIKFLTREERVKYTVNLRVLGEAVAHCLGLHPQVKERDHWLQIGLLSGADQRP